MLILDDVHCAYGSIAALRGVSLRVEGGEIVCLIGANGAGKSTTLMAISGIVPVTSGVISFRGAPVTRVSPSERVRRGIVQVPEGRRIFADMTVRDNLLMGAHLSPDPARIAADMERVFHLFPILQERHAQIGGTLSGGEQQMLAIGRALMGRPEILMLDEPSLGLAPLLVARIASVIAEINRQGTTVLLVEQNASVALRLAHRGYVLETGRVVLEGRSEDLARDPQVREAYLGG
ncbi:MAG: ABC transporter ATP-binding protein [Candidatus Latescibacteria bacterium]|nr:ABC transporter ATP-binding protein [Candidatus Latescibacterota bacterium]